MPERLRAIDDAVDAALARATAQLIDREHDRVRAGQVRNGPDPRLRSGRILVRFDDRRRIPGRCRQVDHLYVGAITFVAKLPAAASTRMRIVLHDYFRTEAEVQSI